MKREILKVKSWNIDACENRAVNLLKTHIWRVKKALHLSFFGPFCVILERQTEDEKFMDECEDITKNDIFKDFQNETPTVLERRIKYFKLLPTLRPNHNWGHLEDYMLKDAQKKLDELKKGAA